MKRPSSLPVVVQVGALAALAVVMSQAVAFAVVVLAPEPRPAGFSIADAASALNGGTPETADGRVLRRRLTDHPVARSEIDRGNPMALAIRAGLANSLASSTRLRSPPERNFTGVRARSGLNRKSCR